MFDLSQWKEQRMGENLAAGLPVEKGCCDVTVLSYVFGSKDKMPQYVESIELALRETYRWCGRLKTTLVVNQMTERLEYLQSVFGADLRIDVDNTLKMGDIVGFSRNMIKTMPNRFDTSYVLNIHPDGFPLRSALEGFLGKWDYIGGPWNIQSDDFVSKILLSRNDGAGNGGFALRSRKICEIGASAYNRLWKIIPDCYLLYEDIFFTRFLPRWHIGYSKEIALAPRQESLRFSLCEDLLQDERMEDMPFGFHSWAALRKIKEHFRT
ncbi:MAG: hypothetical protein J6S30_01170 [Kiritimatiellae bacterium]|nr:hypothetical protein [Kiritimatiellia bacterium]